MATPLGYTPQVALSGAMVGVVVLHLLVIWYLKQRTLRKGQKWHGAPAALAFPAWEIVLVLVGFQGVCQSCFITMRSTNCDGGKWCATCYPYPYCYLLQCTSLRL